MPEESRLVQAFERAAHLLSQEPDSREVEIVTCRVQRTGRTSQLTLVVDRPGGVDIALCERLASRINAALEGFSEPYALSVESPGLDRPLTKPSDYQRFYGQTVRIRTSVAVPVGPAGAAKTHHGILLGLRETNVLLRTEHGELPLPLAIVKSANLEYDPRADLKKQKREKRSQNA